jgi:hypothetical protein
MRSPVSYFALMLAISVALAGYFGVVFMRTGFSVMPLLFVLLFVAGTVIAASELKRFRLAADGLTIQNLLTRRTRVIPYPSIEKVARGFENESAERRAHYLLRVHHPGGVQNLRFFDRSDRDAYQERLEACRQGAVAENADRAELPRAQVVGQDWTYPWRRAAR